MLGAHVAKAKINRFATVATKVLNLRLLNTQLHPPKPFIFVVAN
jgi:hypothetical protein